MKTHFYKNILLILLLNLFISCSFFKEEIPQEQAINRLILIQQKELFEKGKTLFDKGQFQESQLIFKEYLKKYPASNYYLLTQFYLGKSYETLGFWEEALREYKAVLLISSQNNKEMEAQTLYRISFCYEALDQDNTALGTLLDVLKRSKYLSYELAKAEVPARLAGVYARIGNLERAEFYYKQADTGLTSLKKFKNQESPRWLATTLYYMGFLTTKTIKITSFETDLKPFSRNQKYLLLAIEQNDPLWSERAQKELMNIYDYLLFSIESVSLQEEDDPLIGARERQKKQWSMTHVVLDLIHDLKNIHLPASEIKNNFLIEFDFHIDKIEKKLKKIIVQPTIGQELTPEAKTQEKLLRPGKVIDPDQTLENEMMIKKDRKNNKLNKDPNL